MTVIEKIEELFGDNYLIKSKKVKEFVQTELTNYQGNEKIHHFFTDKTYKVGKARFQVTLHATQMKSGVWWIQC